GYEALRKGSLLMLPPARPYRDYIQWLAEQDHSKAEGYWRRKLQGFLSPTPLPWGGSPDASRDADQGRQVWIMPEQASQELRKTAARFGVTLNTIVQGVWAILLSRHCGERDVLFGATVAGRPADLAGVESMVGLFINTLPVRIDVDSHQKIADWLKGLQQNQAEARQFEYTPLVDIQRNSDVERGTPLFETLLVVENYAQEAFESSY